MSGPTFYLETSVWGSLAPRQPRDRKQVVHRLLSLLDGVRAECVISDVVRTEIEEASPSTTKQILEQIEQAQPKTYPITLETELLAMAYISAGVLPRSREADALHVAAATVFLIDFLVSWNHRHMTRPKKRLEYQSVDLLYGYVRTPLICNPFEACNEIRDREIPGSH